MLNIYFVNKTLQQPCPNDLRLYLAEFEKCPKSIVLGED